MSLKSKIPWWSKIAAKLVLARVPLGYQLWSNMGLFVHGAMKDPTYAYAVFERHFNIAKPAPGFVSIEMGPGDSLFSAILSYAFGGSQSYLIDVGPFVGKEVEPYKALARFAREKGHKVPDIEHATDISEILKACNATYLTNGLSSFKTLPDQSIDLVWSQAVLEHVRKAEFADTVREMRRVIKPSGSCSHEVDLKDHLQQSLNSLRFSEATWEGDFFSQSGFYTNRLRFPQLQKLFEEGGFQSTLIDAKKWEVLPISRSALHQDFAGLSDQDLLISSFTVHLRPR